VEILDTRHLTALNTVAVKNLVVKNATSSANANLAVKNATSSANANLAVKNATSNVNLVVKNATSSVSVNLVVKNATSSVNVNLVVVIRSITFAKTLNAVIAKSANAMTHTTANKTNLVAVIRHPGFKPSNNNRASIIIIVLHTLILTDLVFA
jgi:hypothetical protein